MLFYFKKYWIYPLAGSNHFQRQREREVEMEGNEMLEIVSGEHFLIKTSSEATNDEGGSLRLAAGEDKEHTIVVVVAATMAATKGAEFRG